MRWFAGIDVCRANAEGLLLRDLVADGQRNAYFDVTEAGKVSRKVRGAIRLGVKALERLERPCFAKRDSREVQMVEKAVTCQVSCQLCGWNVGGTITADEGKLLDKLLRFLGRCSLQHPSRGSTGKLLVSWELLEPVTN